ncbi:MAG: hypothetical protein LC725_02615, partial [Lentisphaerae bacterium]|nr:hypothetical protein [Lentisphaerota bacterium]
MSQYTCTPAMHGRRHLEFEITYPLDITAGNERYRLDVWFHIPRPLLRWDIGNAREYFFANLLSHTRFKAFELPLRVLSDTHDQRSPLARIHALTESGTLHQAAAIERMIYELRMLVNIFQSQFRGQCGVLEHMLKDAQTPEPDIATIVNRLTDEVGKVLSVFHALETNIMSAHTPQVIRCNYRWTDESLSVRAEKNFSRIHRILTTAEILPQLTDLCRDKIAEQIEHRRSQHYETLAQPDDERANELFSYREHQLKKWAESSMYMNITTSRTPDRIMHLLFGAAAASAMTMAVLLALLADRYFHTRSYPWVLLAVIAYVLKDRTKELLRACSLRWMPHLTYDRIQHIINPYTRRKTGSTRERLTLTNVDRTPEPVQRLRHNRQHAYQSLNTPEDVLHYHKDVRFQADALLATEPRLTALAEIIRLDMRHWFYRMDKSDDRIVHVEDGRLHTVKARRVY